jgi:hypothetical protein
MALLPVTAPSFVTAFPSWWRGTLVASPVAARNSVEAFAFEMFSLLTAHVPGAPVFPPTFAHACLAWSGEPTNAKVQMPFQVLALPSERMAPFHVPPLNSHHSWLVSAEAGPEIVNAVNKVSAVNPITLR